MNSVRVGTSRGALGVFFRLLKGVAYFLVGSLALVGIVAITLELHSWHTGTRWQPTDIDLLLQKDGLLLRTLARIWEDIKYCIQYGAYFLAALAFFIAVAQIKTVAQLIRDFIDARGPIYALASIITRVEKSVEVITPQVDRLLQLEPTIKATAERLEEVVQRLGDLQRLAVSERDQAQLLAVEAPESSAAPPLVAEDRDAQNWERLREYWNANGRRLDDVIERIPDKRRRTKFRRMPRTNYPAIINGLADERLISEVAREASLNLHRVFMSYRPRNRKIPDSVVGELAVYDAQLEQEISQALEPAQPSDEPPPGSREHVKDPVGTPA
jgi:hypothetical protein